MCNPFNWKKLSQKTDLVHCCKGKIQTKTVSHKCSVRCFCHTNFSYNVMFQYYPQEWLWKSTTNEVNKELFFLKTSQHLTLHLFSFSRLKTLFEVWQCRFTWKMVFSSTIIIYRFIGGGKWVKFLQLLMMIRAQQQRRFIDINALRINQTLHFNIVSSFFSYGHTNMIQVHMRIYWYKCLS